MSDLRLAHDFAFADLYDQVGLGRLDAAFLAHLTGVDPGLGLRLGAARARPEALAPKEESELLVALAPHLEDFVADLFGIRREVAALRARHDALAPIYDCKRLFVRRRAAKALTADEAAALDGTALEADLVAAIGAPVTEPTFARAVMGWLEDEPAHGAVLAAAERFAAWATQVAMGRARFAGGFLFHLPHKLDHQHLIEAETVDVADAPALALPPERQRHREGFALTDPGMDLAAALDHAHYCIFCHNQGKDSCAKGFRDKTGGFRANPLGIPLNGCPLDEKISEMNMLKAAGHALGALAVVAVDNPLLAATGHRICNDCMKACIYQKQEPVDIPQVETRVLKDVLDLPWGFEIYGLLTRWNPLDLRRPLPRVATGRRVLVVGLGPAGFNLAHHLLRDGHTVVGVDGLKIEPLAAELSGVASDGARVPFRPVRDLAELVEPLDRRVMAGFGGVAEYGITVRWNKNYLKIVRLLLERNRAFTMIGGVRMGGTLGIERAFALGFDHVALCVGAGRPTYLDLPNGLARGVRAASDFLMALQLTGAARTDSIANLQVRLPVVVVGGGLTAIDTATEALAYYPVQVEKFLARYEALAAERGEVAVRAAWDTEEAVIADEFLAHGRALRAERARAVAEGRAPDLRRVLDGWGGVTLAYRKRLVDAPSYRLNHEEVGKALEEGIRFAEGLSPTAVAIDRFGHAEAILMDRAGASVRLPARTIMVAAGTHPNTVLAREEPGLFGLDAGCFAALDEDGAPAPAERSAKPTSVRVLAHLCPDGRAVSTFGDVHPSFAGNVVKAMGGAKQGYPVITRLLARLPRVARDDAAFRAALDGLRACVHAVNRLTPTIVEVVVEAPFAARAFRPGQFYRLQNFETLAPRTADTTLAMEGLAMTGAWTDPDRGLLGLIVLEMGGSSDLTAMLRPGEPVVVMGPTGTPTEIVPGETVLLAGGGLGNAVLFSIGRAMRAAGCRVLYFAGYRDAADRYKVADIEAAADVVVWSCDRASGFAPGRPQDLAHIGTIVEAMVAYHEGRLGARPIALEDVDRVVAIGSDRMMAAVKAARHGVFAGVLKPCHHALGSINSPMQCMMKEICAQCLQPQVDPATGAPRPPVFSCFNQDQALDAVDFPALAQRLRQNSVQEKLTAQWIDRCLRGLALRPAAE
ncbi:MAG: pyridine nucleotide-disulfide oxidoreductase [Alphaproteobacteria bacterium]|nr:pyridine nucleotide-disulfide oxidoreductase [Alphaproteobacteria bacterium]